MVARLAQPQFVIVARHEEVDQIVHVLRETAMAANQVMVKFKFDHDPGSVVQKLGTWREVFGRWRPRKSPAPFPYQRAGHCGRRQKPWNALYLTKNLTT